jgi:predicted oxidoreductase
VYNLLKNLYGLKQALQAWYARLKTFLLEHGYIMGSVDKILFTLNHGIDFLLVHIYMSGFQEMMNK